MATFETKNQPFQYNENGTIQNVTLVSVFDTELKKIFIYENTLFGRTLLATSDPSENTIVPFQDQNGSFNVTGALRTELVTNQQLKQSINTAINNAAKEYLNPNGAFNPNSISQQQVDTLLGTNASATQAPPAAVQPTPVGSSPATPPNSAVAQSDPNLPTQTEIDSFSIPTKPGANDPKKYKSSDGGGGLRYPIKISPDEDYVKFQVYEYKPKTLSGALNSPVGDVVGGLLGECILPIQSQISDSNTVGWGDGRINAIQLEAFRLAKTGISEGLPKMASEAGTALDKLLKGNSYKAGFGIYAAAAAAQVNNVFARTTGGILNPNLELLFEGPELRTFNFQFQLSPRNKGEAQLVREIIKFFKRSMSVNKSDTDIFLKSPHVFKITYAKNGGQHKSLNRFKTCALRSFNVDYTPLGTYMTFNDPAGTMVSYGLSMQFQEIDPIFNEDYDKVGADEIGF